MTILIGERALRFVISPWRGRRIDWFGQIEVHPEFSPLADQPVGELLRVDIHLPGVANGLRNSIFDKQFF